MYLFLLKNKGLIFRPEPFRIALRGGDLILLIHSFRPNGASYDAATHDPIEVYNLPGVSMDLSHRGGFYPLTYLSQTLNRP